MNAAKALHKIADKCSDYNCANNGNGYVKYTEWREYSAGKRLYLYM